VGFDPRSVSVVAMGGQSLVRFDDTNERGLGIARAGSVGMRASHGAKESGTNVVYVMVDGQFKDVARGVPGHHRRTSVTCERMMARTAFWSVSGSRCQARQTSRKSQGKPEGKLFGVEL
jgi:hypothetical protein